MRVLLVLALAGCPAQNQYLVAQVTARRVPVADAMVAVDCGRSRTAVQRTDDRGRAQLRLLADTQANRCVVTVAAPQLPTIDAAGATLCTSPNACPAMWIDLDSQVMR